MKKIITFVIVGLCSYNLFSQNVPVQKASVTSTAQKEAEIVFESTEFNFGKIKEGEKVENTFRFKNTGNTALIITDVNVTCGCTAAEKPQAPIQPGEEGKIKIVFNSAGKTGTQNRTITVNSNAKTKSTYLKLVGEVINDKQEKTN